MAILTIYPNGVKEIEVPATESIAISNFGGGIAKIYYLIENANRPDAWQFQQTLENSSVTLGAFTNDTIVKIESGASKVNYEVATAPSTALGDANTLDGNPSSYYAVDAETMHTDDDDPVTYTEAGTWTVGLYDASSGGNQSATTVTGYYTRIGNMVMATFINLNDIDTTGMTAGNALYVGLPIAAATLNLKVSCAGNIIFDNLTHPANTVQITPNVTQNTQRGAILVTLDGAAETTLKVSDISTGVTDIARFSIIYFTD